METDGAGRAVAAEHQRARIVAEQRAGHSAEMREGRRDALAPIVAALIEKRFDEEAARVAEHRDQEKDPDAARPPMRSRFWPKSICSWSPGAVSTRTVASAATRCARRMSATARSTVRTLIAQPRSASSRCTTTALPAAGPS